MFRASIAALIGVFAGHNPDAAQQRKLLQLGRKPYGHFGLFSSGSKSHPGRRTSAAALKRSARKRRNVRARAPKRRAGR